MKPPGENRRVISEFSTKNCFQSEPIICALKTGKKQANVNKTEKINHKHTRKWLNSDDYFYKTKKKLVRIRQNETKHPILHNAS